MVWPMLEYSSFIWDPSPKKMQVNLKEYKDEPPGSFKTSTAKQLIKDFHQPIAAAKLTSPIGETCPS